MEDPARYARICVRWFAGSACRAASFVGVDIGRVAVVTVRVRRIAYAARVGGGAMLLLGRVVGGLDGALVRAVRLCGASTPSQEVGSDGVPEVVAVEVERFDLGERRRWSFDLGQSNGAVEFDDLCRRDGQGLVVDREDLSP